jgi:phosphate:Na+ symporter
MFGMDTMSGAVEGLKDVPEFTNILLQFSNPILGMIAGLVLTAVIQSSSASVGILQALCITGAVPFSAALPIIMGQNIGTCVTAMLSGIGASKNAKRTALVHLYFNLIGTIVFMIGFYAINAVVPFSFLQDAATPVGIATLHSVFNITATIMWLPFSKVLVKLATISVKEDEVVTEISEEEKVLQLLDIRFLESPSIAVEQSRNVAMTMAGLAEESMNLSLELLGAYDEIKANKVVELENTIDRFEDELGSYLVKLSSRNLSERDSHVISTILHCIGDFERIMYIFNISTGEEYLEKQPNKEG